MNAPSLPAPESKPYKGPESYQIEDAQLFFGRNLEADQLIAKILSSRLTLLHAQSGAGKTSLLNARIIPGLETRGWGAFRILPQNDPVVSVRASTLRYVLPPPAAERQAIERALAGLQALTKDSTLDDLLSCYDALQPRDALRRLLIAPLTLSSSDPATTGVAGNMMPVFCRLLRSSIELETFIEHLNAVQLPTGTALFDDGRMRLHELLDAVSAPAFDKKLF